MSNVPDHWIPHIRDDGEVIGWIDVDSAAPHIVPIDRLGRSLDPVTDWMDAEFALDELGLRFLMNHFRSSVLRVRIRQLYDDRIIVTTAASDAIGDVGEEFVLTFPAGAQLAHG